MALTVLTLFVPVSSRFRSCDPASQTVLSTLRDRGFVTGIGSNYDHRLRKVLAGFPALAAAGHVVISAEIGWRKPAPEFFAAITPRTARSCFWMSFWSSQKRTA